MNVMTKAFDTVWRDGLYYKLLSEYNISDKFLRILQYMYSDLRGCVNINVFYSQ